MQCAQRIVWAERGVHAESLDAAWRWQFCLRAIGQVALAEELTDRAAFVVSIARLARGAVARCIRRSVLMAT